MKQLIERFEKQNLSLILEERIEGSRQFLAKAEKIVSKARFKKPEFYYRFRNQENMISYLESYIANLEKIQERREEMKRKKKEAAQSFEHGFYVGQVLYESWGYEQTNLRYYQIVGFKGKSAILRKIGKVMVSESSWASGLFKPEINGFCGEPFVKRIVPSVGWNGEISYHISMGEVVGSLMKYNEGQENFCSWYA